MKNIIIILYSLFFSIKLFSQNTFIGHFIITNQNEYSSFSQDGKLILSTYNKVRARKDSNLIENPDNYSLSLFDNNNVLCFFQKKGLNLRQKNNNAYFFQKIPFKQDYNKRCFNRKTALRNTNDTMQFNEIYCHSVNVAECKNLLSSTLQNPCILLYHDIVSIGQNQFFHFIYYPDEKKLEQWLIKGNIVNVKEGCNCSGMFSNDFIEPTLVKEYSNLNFEQGFKIFYEKKKLFLLENNGLLYNIDSDNGLQKLQNLSLKFFDKIWVENKKENYVGYILKSDFEQFNNTETLYQKIHKINVD